MAAFLRARRYACRMIHQHPQAQRELKASLPFTRDAIQRGFTRRCVRWLFHVTPLGSVRRIYHRGLLPAIDGQGDGGRIILSVSHPDTMAMYRRWRDHAEPFAILRIPSHVCWLLDCEFWYGGKPLSGDIAKTLEYAFSDQPGQPQRPNFFPRHWPTWPCLEARIGERIPASQVAAVIVRDQKSAQSHANILAGLPVWIDAALFCARRPRYYE